MDVNNADCVFLFVQDFILTEQQRKEMTLEEQLKDLQEKLDMTQAIKHGGTLTVIIFWPFKYVACLQMYPMICFGTKTVTCIVQ